MSTLYKVIILANTQKQIKKLPVIYAKKAIEIIESLKANPRPKGVIKLVGTIDRYRIRMGVYRILYQIKNDVLIIYVFDVDHRKQV